MVNANLILELEKEGMEYKLAFNVANLMETEGLSRKQAIKRVMDKLEKTNAVTDEETEKLKAENKEKAKVK